MRYTVPINERGFTMKDKKALRLAMKTRNMTQLAFAEKLGYTSSGSVSMLLNENNGKALKTDTLIKALNILGYDIVVKDRFSGEEIATLTEE